MIWTACENILGKWKQIQNLFVKTKHTELKQERDIIGLPIWLRYDQTGLVNLPIV